jgi:Ca2+-binding RTX toxin-like protein
MIFTRSREAEAHDLPAAVDGVGYAVGSARKRPQIDYGVLSSGVRLPGDRLRAHQQRDCNGGDCVGTRSNDTLFGTPKVDEEFGLGSGDLMYGYERADRMSGGAGGDRMYGGIGADTVNGDDGNDAVYGGRSDDAVNGGSGDDTLMGDAGNYTISGDVGGDLIQAVDGQKDQINCAGGRDKVYYDRGLDVLRRCEGLNPR